VQVGLEGKSWFHPTADRKAAESRLSGTAVGTFLVRASSDKSGYTLSLVNVENKIRHFKLLPVDGGKWCVESKLSPHLQASHSAHCQVTRLSSHCQSCTCFPTGVSPASPTPGVTGTKHDVCLAVGTGCIAAVTNVATTYACGNYVPFMWQLRAVHVATTCRPRCNYLPFMWQLRTA
jgi:hypothetical protein